MQIISTSKLQRSTPTSAGYDLCADLDEPSTLHKGDIALIPTGIALSLGAKDLVAKIYARSDLATLYGLRMSSGVEIVDVGYTDEIFVPLVNSGYDDFVIKPGMKVAQMIFERVVHPNLEEVDQFGEYDYGYGPDYGSGRLH